MTSEELLRLRWSQGADQLDALHRLMGAEGQERRRTDAKRDRKPSGRGGDHSAFG